MSLSFDLTYVALWGLVLFQSLVLFGLLRESAETRRKVAVINAGGAAGGAAGGRLELGEKAPSFSAVEARSGRTVRRDDLAGRRSILLFLSPSCRNCEKLAAGIHGIYHKAEGHLYIVCQAPRDECLEFIAAHSRGLSLPILLDPERDLSGSFRIYGAPMAVMLDEDLRIRSYGSPKESDELAEIVNDAAAGEAGETPAAAVR